MRWPGQAGAHVLSGFFGASSPSGSSSASRGRRPKQSVLIIDGSNDWHRYSHRLHRWALAACATWGPLSVTPGARANSYRCNEPAVAQASGEWANSLLQRFKNDPFVASALARLYGVHAAACDYGEDGAGLNVIIQNQTMLPDSFHPDLCAAPRGWAQGHRGLTLLTYPHHTWNASWLGHLELAGPNMRTVARLAPLRNRSVILDACIWHRATNPGPGAAPLHGRGAIASPRLWRLLGYSQGYRRWHFQAWRFAVVMQLRCPLLGDQGTSTVGTQQLDAASAL